MLICIMISYIETWYEYFNVLNDEIYKEKLLGVLARQYVSAVRRMKIIGWKVCKINFTFAMKYALNLKKKLRFFYLTFPLIFMLIH